MFKYKKKKQQQSIEIEEDKGTDYKLDEIHLDDNDFRSSLILSQLNLNAMPSKLISPPLSPINEAQHLASLDMNEKNSAIPQKEVEFDYKKEAYKPTLDEEDFFFKDFASNNNNNTSLKKMENTSLKPNPVSRFDLSRFAKDLNDHRLSVIQSRQTTMVLTEEDELELERLLQKPLETNQPITPLETSKEQKVVIEEEQKSTTEQSTFVEEQQPSLKQQPIIEPKVSKKPQQQPSIESKVTKGNQLVIEKSVSMTTEQKAHAESIQVHEKPQRKIKSLDGKKEQENDLHKKDDDFHVSPNSVIDENETSVTLAALDWFENPKPIKTMSLDKSPPRPRRMQSVRQESQPLRGLVRSKSTNSNHSRYDASTINKYGMSRAAMAAIQHTVTKQEPQRHSDTTIVSQLLSRASSTRKKNTPKVINMNNHTTSTDDVDRNQTVRKTIIYVEPDSLHQLLKNGGSGVHIPPLVKKNRHIASFSSSSDSSTIDSFDDVLEANEIKHADIPPPIPRRSPNRPSSCKPPVKIHRTNDSTLPSLMKLIDDQCNHMLQQEQYEKTMDSIDHQLDEMIKIVSGQ